ncbi:MAG: DUF1566 domain-containing protein [Rikenellaceae bacterium]
MNKVVKISIAILALVVVMLFSLQMLGGKECGLFASSVVVTPEPGSYVMISTGQTKFYNVEGEEIEEPQKGDSLWGQDATYKKGAVMKFRDNNDGTITDLNTNLEWQMIPTPEGMTWNEAKEYCESLELGGHSDWRMPTMKELFSIADFSEGWPYVDTTYFKLASGRVSKDEQFWSSDKYVGVTVEGRGDAAFGLNHGTGHIKAYPAGSSIQRGGDDNIGLRQQGINADFKGAESEGRSRRGAEGLNQEGEEGQRAQQGGRPEMGDRPQRGGAGRPMEGDSLRGGRQGMPPEGREGRPEGMQENGEGRPEGEGRGQRGGEGEGGERPQGGMRPEMGGQRPEGAPEGMPQGGEGRPQMEGGNMPPRMGGNNPMAKQVRAVRGAAYGENDFVDNGDGTITDNASALMWARDDNGEGVEWVDALRYSQTNALAGYSDWRLPNLKELQSIVDYQRAPNGNRVEASINPMFNCTQIVNEAGDEDYGYYWTGTSARFAKGQPFYFAWYVAFGRAVNNQGQDFHGAGAVRFDSKSNNGLSVEGGEERYYNFVRLVRDI